MSHPFEVGKPYRNRVGEYVVESIDGAQMTIRYTSGGTLETSVRIQRRIWENIQFEERSAREEERQRLAKAERLEARRRARRERLRPKFGGFQEQDFQPKKRGIAWSTRKKLGQVLAYELTETSKKAYESWIVPRKSIVHVSRKGKYDKEHRDRNSALFVMASEEGLFSGFYLCKPEGKAKTTWPWSRFSGALDEGDTERKIIRTAMKELGFRLDVYSQGTGYGLVARVTVEGPRFVWVEKTAEQETIRKLTWPQLINALKGLSESRTELYLGGLISVGEALKAGPAISIKVLEIFEILMPVYNVSIGL